VWGYSYGANVGRYLPTRSDRVTKLVIIGIAFGAAAPGPIRNYALNLRRKWQPVIEAWRAGTLDVASLSEQDRAWWEKGHIPLTIAQLDAILGWPPLEPADLPCPTLWLVGTANENAMPSVDEFRDRLAGTSVTVETVLGLTHAQELTEVDRVLGPMIRFTLGELSDTACSRRRPRRGARRG
jgi:pimeloyl-ACP methyl ester carboxylesterase